MCGNPKNASREKFQREVEKPDYDKADDYDKAVD